MNACYLRESDGLELKVVLEGRDVEARIIGRLHEFLLELRCGFAFVDGRPDVVVA